MPTRTPPADGRSGPETAPLAFACPGCAAGLRARAALAGTDVRCPACGQVVPVPGPPGAGGPGARFPLRAALLLGALVVGGAVWGNLRANLHNEYFNIARALVAGRGFADAVGAPTGPTAWMPPLLPALEAVLLWAGGGDRDVVVAGLVVLHVGVLVGTAFLVLALAARTTRRLGAGVAASVFCFGLLYHSWFWFQLAHDCWLPLLTLDLLIAGLCWLRPLGRWPGAAGWGLFGAVCALTSPVVGFVWGVMSVVLAARQRAWPRLALAVGCAGLALAPWVLRNALVFGRFIPVKSNLGYELYQSQCLQPDGLLQHTAWRAHPSQAGSREQQEYRALGEVAYLDRKWQQFRESVRADPGDFLDRVASRFLGATVWYVPFNRAEEARQPWVLWVRRLTHPLPFLALLLLIWGDRREPLAWAQWAVIGVYLLYLLPYVGASYYERYAVPLLGVKALLVLWAADRLPPFGFFPSRGGARGPGRKPRPAPAPAGGHPGEAGPPRAPKK